MWLYKFICLVWLKCWLKQYGKFTTLIAFVLPVQNSLHERLLSVLILTVVTQFQDGFFSPFLTWWDRKPLIWNRVQGSMETSSSSNPGLVMEHLLLLLAPYQPLPLFSLCPSTIEGPPLASLLYFCLWSLCLSPLPRHLPLLCAWSSPSWPVAA